MQQLWCPVFVQKSFEGAQCWSSWKKWNKSLLNLSFSICNKASYEKTQKICSFRPGFIMKKLYISKVPLFVRRNSFSLITIWQFLDTFNDTSYWVFNQIISRGFYLDKILEGIFLLLLYFSWLLEQRSLWAFTVKVPILKKLKFRKKYIQEYQFETWFGMEEYTIHEKTF